MARTPAQPTSTAKSRLRRADLLSAAEQAFADRGYVETTVADIIAIAGGSRASFYSYFSSKDDALSALIQELTDDLFDAATPSVPPGATAFAVITESIRQFMEAYRERAALLLILDQATTVSPVFLQIRKEIRARFATSLEATLRDRFRRRPDPDGLDARLTAMALGGMVEDMARGRYLFRQDVADDDAVRTLAILWARSLDIPTR